MTALAGATVLAAGFLLLVRLFRVVERSGEAVATARLALSDFRHPGLDDDAKEVALQRHARRLFALFAAITLGGAAAIGLPAVLVWLLGQSGLVSFDAVLATALSWPFILGGTGLGIAAFALMRRR